MLQLVFSSINITSILIFQLTQLSERGKNALKRSRELSRKTTRDQSAFIALKTWKFGNTVDRYQRRSSALEGTTVISKVCEYLMANILLHRITKHSKSVSRTL